MSEGRDKVIRGVCYDADNGFGSISATYQQAHHILNTLTLYDVNNCLSRQKSRQTEAYRGFTSYLCKKEPLQYIQIDIAGFTRSAEVNDGYIYCFVAVDIFTQIYHAVPIKDKQPAESIRVFNEVLEKIGVMNTFPPPFAERMVQTIKNMIHQRLEGLGIS